VYRAVQKQLYVCENVVHLLLAGLGERVNVSRNLVAAFEGLGGIDGMELHLGACTVALAASIAVADVGVATIIGDIQRNVGRATQPGLRVEEA